MTGFGDKLARGAASASYATTDKKITDEKWKSMFEGWDIVKFLEETSAVESEKYLEDGCK